MIDYERQTEDQNQTEKTSENLDAQIENIRRRAFEMGYTAGYEDGYLRRAVDDLNNDLKEFSAQVK